MTLLKHSLIVLTTALCAVACGKGSSFKGKANPVNGSKEDDQVVKPTVAKAEEFIAPDNDIIDSKIEEAPIVAVINGQPSGDSNIVKLDISVSGENVAQYVYALVAADNDCANAKYADTPVDISNKISDDISSFANGPVTVCVLGYDANNKQQDKNAPTKASWKKAVPSVLAAALDCGGIADGAAESRVRFKDASVDFGNSCVSETQQRTCHNGTFDAWSGSYASTNCSVKAPAACGAVAHNTTQTRKRYQSASAAFGSNCVSEDQTRKCTNGTLSAWTGNFTATSCNVSAASSCGSTPHNGTESRKMYQSASVPFGSTCASEDQTRTCSNGTFGNWSGTYAATSCSVTAAASCGSVAHNGQQTRTRYQSASVPYGSSCVAQTQTRTCSDGTFGAWSGSYTATSCTPAAPANCSGLAHGATQTRTRYLASSVPYGSSCAAETQTQTCTNGQLSGWSGSYAVSSCSAYKRCDISTTATIGFELSTPLVERYLTLSLPADAQNISFDIYDWYRNTNSSANMSGMTYMSSLVINGVDAGAHFEQVGEHTPKGDVGPSLRAGVNNKIGLDPNGACPMAAYGGDCTRVTIYARGSYDTLSSSCSVAAYH